MMSMDIQHVCSVCEKKTSKKNYAVTRHLKKHNLTTIEYIKLYYKLLSGDFEKCGFCDDESIPSLDINHLEKSYSISYPKGYSCKTQRCKNIISLDILGIEYDPKKFEKIGSRSEYLSKLYKIELSDAKSMKFDVNKTTFFDNSLESFVDIYGEKEGMIRHTKRIDGISKNNARNKFPCTLENFIKKYGDVIGTKKYNDRCEKISYTSSKDFFIKKHGDVEGGKIWKNKFKQNRVSKKSKVISEILNQLDINFEIEKNISSKFVDYYLTDYDIVIEYFGDYWHGNPKRYEVDFYISQLKMCVGDLWEKDKERLCKIKKEVDSIIIVWESTKIDSTLLEKTINNIKNKKTIIYL